MKKKQWKKIVLVLFIAFLLVFTFWYGGNAPGLQGFLTEDNIEQTADTKESAKDAEENVAQTTENGDVVQNTEENATTEAVTTEEETVFQQIVMHIKKKEDSSGNSNKSSKKKATTKQVQNTKKAQKNANKTAKKESKKKKSTTSKKKTNKESTETTKAVTTEQKNPDTIQCTIYISCATVLDNMDRVPTAKKKIIPSDGVILKEVQVSVSKDATVFDVLQKATKDNKIHLEYTYTPLYKNYYIEGIYNLYEFDCGNGSGWLYSVNGEFPSEGCSTYDVKDGDIIQWLYTCDFGEDVGKYIK